MNVMKLLTIEQTVEHCIANNGGTFDIYPGHIRQLEYDRQDLRPQDVSPESWDARRADLRTFVPVSLGDGASSLKPVPSEQDLSYCGLDPAVENLGYFVSVKDVGVIVDNLDCGILAGYLKNMAPYLKWALPLGVWFDGERWHLDFSVYAKTKERAEWLCKSHNQTAYWDCWNEYAVEVK